MVVVLFLPAVISYQIWAYRLFRGPTDPADTGYGEQRRRGAG